MCVCDIQKGSQTSASEYSQLLIDKVKFSEYMQLLINKTKLSESTFSEWMNKPYCPDTEKRYNDAHNDLMSFIRAVRKNM